MEIKAPAQSVVWEDPQGGARVVCMDSMGHVDQRNGSNDVLVAGSHSAECSVQLVVRLRPRGLIGHAAGPGVNSGGVAGLAVMEKCGIPAAAVSGESAPISDGISMYERGELSHVNGLAEELGIRRGDRARDAAHVFASRLIDPQHVVPIQNIMYEGFFGRVVAVDTIKYGDDRINDAVLCMGSHSGAAMADYLEPYRVRGTITNDAGNPLDNSGTVGMERLQQRGVPAAVVSNDTAIMGDGRSTYLDGLISGANRLALELGVLKGMPASVAAFLMLGSDVE